MSVFITAAEAVEPVDDEFVEVVVSCLSEESVEYRDEVVELVVLLDVAGIVDNTL